jgi:hypothetical protein
LFGDLALLTVIAVVPIAVDTVFEGKRKISPTNANSNCFDR